MEHDICAFGPTASCGRKIVSVAPSLTSEIITMRSGGVFPVMGGEYHRVIADVDEESVADLVWGKTTLDLKGCCDTIPDDPK